MATRALLSGCLPFGLAFAFACSGCSLNEVLDLGPDSGTENPTDTTTGSETDTSTVTMTQTKTAAPTDTATATSTMTVTRTTTTTQTTAATSTATSTPGNTATATATPSGTGTATASATATSTGSSTGSATGTSAATSTATATTTATVTVVVTTATVTATATKVSTYNGYTLERTPLPPVWTCPADTGAGGAGGAGGSSGAANQLPTDSALATTDCKSLANLRRPILKVQSQSQLDQVRASLIATNCSPRTQDVCVDKDGQVVSLYQCYPHAMDAGIALSMGGATSAPGGVGGAAGSGATQYSTTNNQVASVDEADYVKNDGNTIFVLSSDGLHVIDAWPADGTHEVARVSLPGTPRRLFLLDNRLVVYTRGAASGTTGSAGASNPSDQGCTYGYSCRFSSEGGHTMIQVFDVTTPASPAELVRYEMSGGYVDSRRIGSFVYTMVHDTGATQVAGLDYSLSGATSYDDLQAKYAQLLAANFAKIDASSDDFFLPWTKMTRPGGTATLINSCAYALATQYAEGGSFVSIDTFDLTTLAEPSRTILASNAGYIYASPTSLYMAVDRTYEQNYSTSVSSAYATYQATDSFVHKFKLSGTDTSYVGSVTLPGHILNQFAMDEDGGVLRVASTRGWDPDPSVTSFVTTFAEQNGILAQQGQVGDIATGEDIRSVRFDGDRGFVVTFKKTDPLFVFDLGNPSAPKKLGELQIPGFSTYMQRLDENHLLAIGFTADDQGSYAYFNGIQIQIFDVTDLANPTLAFKTVIGTRGSNSEALTNHLAFNYFAPKKILAIPITICEGGGNGVYATDLTFAGLMAFDISLDTGITEHGRLPFLDPSTVSTSSDCGKWWTDSKSLVKRSIFMDDFVYGLSDAELRVAGLSNMSSVLQSVPLVSK